MITSTSNARVKWIRKLQSQRKARAAEKAFILEGRRQGEEVLRTQAPLKAVFYTNRFEQAQAGLLQDLMALGAPAALVSEGVMRACSSTETPSGLLMVAPFPDTPLPQPLSLAVLVDRLADPGNMGTLMRTSLAAGVEAFFVAGGSVDVFNPKVVRAAAGAHLRLPVEEVPYRELPLRLGELTIYLASSQEGVPYSQVDWRQPCALVIGGEAHGVSPQVEQVADEAVHIPMPGKTESLNAAVSAAVILFEIVRQRGAA